MKSCSEFLKFDTDILYANYVYIKVAQEFSRLSYLRTILCIMLRNCVDVCLAVCAFDIIHGRKLVLTVITQYNHLGMMFLFCN